MRPARFETEESSEDSFLDVVANVVGVLIILVMLVGAQASRGMLFSSRVETATTESRQVAHESQPTVAEATAELTRVTQVVLAAEKSLRETATRAVRLNHEAEAIDQKRVELAMHRSILEDDLKQRRQKLDTQAQREFDVQRQLTEAKLDLDQLRQEQINLLPTGDAVTEVESVPTPLAKVVEGRAIHLRLSQGLVSIVPFEALMQEAQNNTEGIRRRLQNGNVVTETFGPLEGYRLKVTVAKRRLQGAVEGPRVGQVSQVKVGWEAEVLPVSTELGENVEQALLPTGRLFQHLQAQRRDRPAIVVWLYTDSFDEFRPLKRAIWEMRLSLATRPMRPGTNIKASPEGTRAAAQ